MCRTHAGKGAKYADKIADRLITAGFRDRRDCITRIFQFMHGMTNTQLVNIFFRSCMHFFLYGFVYIGFRDAECSADILDRMDQGVVDIDIFQNMIGCFGAGRGLVYRLLIRILLMELIQVIQNLCQFQVFIPGSPCMCAGHFKKSVQIVSLVHVDYFAI